MKAPTRGVWYIGSSMVPSSACTGGFLTHAPRLAMVALLWLQVKPLSLETIERTNDVSWRQRERDSEWQGAG